MVLEKTNSLLLDFENYRQKNESFNDETFNQFDDDIFKFWKYVEGDYKEPANVVLRIFGICMNSASVKSMWSTIGFFHTNQRNQLNVSFNC
jgi:uncharacterized protein YutD